MESLAAMCANDNKVGIVCLCLSNNFIDHKAVTQAQAHVERVSG